MEAIVYLGRYNKLSQYQKCGLNICCYTRKLTIDRGNEGIFIPQLRNQIYILIAINHDFGYGE